LYHCGTAKTEQLNREFMMSLKKASIAAILAVSMASTPVMAQQGSAAALSVAARSGASTDENSELQGGWFIPLLAAVAVILGIIVLVDGGGDRPSSP
jgi:hypothetical protein